MPASSTTKDAIGVIPDRAPGAPARQAWRRAAALRACFATGKPQEGHVLASVETCLPHSVQAINDMRCLGTLALNQEVG